MTSPRPRAKLPPIFGIEVPDRDVRLTLLPVPFDATASYRRGSAKGSRAICLASTQVDLYDGRQQKAFETGYRLLAESAEIRKKNSRAGHLVDSIRVHPAGATSVRQRDEVNHLCSDVGEIVARQVSTLLESGQKVGLIGGDHSTAFGSIHAHAERYATMGVLHLDAHADLRLAYEGFRWSHASIMRNVVDHTSIATLVQVAVRDFCQEEADFISGHAGRVRTFFDHQIAEQSFAGVSFAEQIQSIVDALPHDVYISFDIDGLDPSLCPNTGTPVPGGLTFQMASALLYAIPASGRRIVGFDLTEVAPGPGGDEWDANVGARVLFLLCALSLGNP